MIRRVALAVAILTSTAGCSLLLETSDLAGGRPGAAELTKSSGGSGDADASDPPTPDGGGPIGDAHADAPAAKPGDAAAALATPTTVFDVGAPINALAVRGDDVYCGTVNEVIHVAPGAAPERVTSRGTLGQMAAGAGEVYFADDSTIFGSSTAAGSTAAALHEQTDAPIPAVALLGDTLFYLSPAPDQPGVTSLFSIPAAGGAVTPVAVGAFEDATSLVVVGSVAYVADRARGAVWTVDLVAGSAAPLLPVVPGVESIAVAPPWIWLTARTGNTSVVLRTTIDGARALETVASDGVRYTQIVVTDRTVYWAAGTKVVSLPREES